MAAPTLVQTATRGSTGASSAGSVTVSTTVGLGSNTTTGNTLVITIQAKTNILNGNRGILPTSGDYNATLNSSYTNVGSSSNPQGGFDCVSAHNKTSTAIYMQTWCFYAAVSSGAAFSETFNFESDHTGTFGIVPHFSVTVEEWSGLDSVVGGTGDMEDNVEDTFGFTQTGVSFANDDILAMHHYCDNDPDDDSVITVNGTATGVTKSNSTNISGNIRRESYRKVVTSGTTFTITYDDDAGTNGGNLTKIMQVLKLVAATSTTHTVTPDGINVNSLTTTSLYFDPSDIQVTLGSTSSGDRTDQVVIQKVDNSWDGGYWTSMAHSKSTKARTFRSVEVSDDASNSPYDIIIGTSAVPTAPQLSYDDCEIAFDFSTSGFAIHSTKIVKELIDPSNTISDADFTSGTGTEFSAFQSMTTTSSAYVNMGTNYQLTGKTVIFQLGTTPTGSGTVYLLGEVNAATTKAMDYYAISNTGATYRHNGTTGTITTTNQWADGQCRVVTVDSTGNFSERINGVWEDQNVSAGALSFNHFFKHENSSSEVFSTGGLELLEFYMFDSVLSDFEIETFEAYLAQKYGAELNYSAGHEARLSPGKYFETDLNPNTNSDILFARGDSFGAYTQSVQGAASSTDDVTVSIGKCPNITNGTDNEFDVTVDMNMD